MWKSWTPGKVAASAQLSMPRANSHAVQQWGFIVLFLREVQPSL